MRVVVFKQNCKTMKNKTKKIVVGYYGYYDKKKGKRVLKTLWQKK